MLERSLSYPRPWERGGRVWGFEIFVINALNMYLPHWKGLWPFINNVVSVSSLSVFSLSLSLSHTHTHTHLVVVDIQHGQRRIAHFSTCVATQLQSVIPLTIHSSSHMQTHPHSTNHLLIHCHYHRRMLSCHYTVMKEVGWSLTWSLRRTERTSW